MDTPYILAELTDREIAQAVVVEMRRRGLLGCVFMFPEGPMVHGVFASSTPAGLLTGYTAAEQLRIFSEVAALSPGEQVTRLADEPTPPKWVN